MLFSTSVQSAVFSDGEHSRPGRPVPVSGAYRDQGRGLTMYHVQDTLAGYESVFASKSKRAALAALRRMQVAYAARDFRLVRDDGTCWTVLA